MSFSYINDEGNTSVKIVSRGFTQFLMAFHFKIIEKISQTGFITYMLIQAFILRCTVEDIMECEDGGVTCRKGPGWESNRGCKVLVHGVHALPGELRGRHAMYFWNLILSLQQKRCDLNIASAYCVHHSSGCYHVNFHWDNYKDCFVVPLCL